jgi:hypothetical protein
MFTRFRATLLMLAAAAFPGWAGVTVYPDKAAIVTAGKEHVRAAEELSLHLELVTGVKVPVLATEWAPDAAYVFAIGQVPHHTPPPAVGKAIWSITPQAAFFYGDGVKGALNAVYDFLEDELGVRWLNRDGDTAYRSQNPLVLNAAGGSWQAPFRHAGIRGGRLWNVRQRMGAYNDPPKYGHAFTKLWQKYGATHPEFFALTRFGVRAPIPKPGQNPNDIAAFAGKAAEAIKVCTASAALREHIVSEWQKSSASRYVNICENDGNDGFCTCAGCAALDVAPDQPAPGNVFSRHYTDRYMHMANEVARAAAAIRPDARVATYAYNEYETPPRRVKLLPQVTVGIVPTVFDLEASEALVQGWRQAGLTEFFWRPNQHYYFDGAQMPFGLEKHFFDLFQAIRRHNPTGFDYDAPGANITSEFSYYVLAKALQEPDQPFEHWEQHFLQAYGAAGPGVGAYYRHWRGLWDRHFGPQLKDILVKGKVFNFARGVMWNLKDFYTEADFDTTDAHLAEAAAQDLLPRERALVDKLRLANTHSRHIFLAVAQPSDRHSMALLEFRRAHGLEEFPHNEQYWGDVTGVRRVEQFKEYAPPYLPTPLFWSFRLDPDNQGTALGWPNTTPEVFRRWDRMPTNGNWETPHRHYPHPTPETRALTANYDGIAWYATTVEIPADWQNRDVFLYFGAVDESCWVFVNGQTAGEHVFRERNDWTTPFTIPISSVVDWSRPRQAIIVKVEDRAGAGGIWKPVWVVSKTR